MMWSCMVSVCFSAHGGEYNSNNVDGVVLQLDSSSLQATVLADELSNVRSRKMLVVIHACFAGRFPVLKSKHNVGGGGGRGGRPWQPRDC